MSAISLQGLLSSPPPQRQFPNPFRCHGSFCAIQIQTLAAEASDKSARPSVISACYLFTQDEISEIKKHKLLEALVSTHKIMIGIDWMHSKRNGTHVVLHKSIVRGQRHKKKLWAALCLLQSVPHGKPNKHVPALRADESYSHAYDKELDVPESLGRQVRVCSNCYDIYQLLDHVHEVLEVSKHHVSDRRRKFEGRSGNLVAPSQNSVGGSCQISCSLSKSKSDPGISTVRNVRTYKDINTLPTLSELPIADKGMSSASTFSDFRSSKMPTVKSLKTCHRTERRIQQLSYGKSCGKVQRNIHASDKREFHSPTGSHVFRRFILKKSRLQDISVLLIGPNDQQVTQFGDCIPDDVQMKQVPLIAHALETFETKLFDIVFFFQDSFECNSVSADKSLFRLVNVLMEHNPCRSPCVDYRPHHSSPACEELDTAIFVVLCTTNLEKLMTYRECGFHGYITVPTTRDRIRSLLENCLAPFYRTQDFNVFSVSMGLENKTPQMDRAQLFTQEDPFATRGSFYYDESTRIPYCILHKHPHDPYFLSGERIRLTVVQDLFENYERLQLLLLPLVKRAIQDLQILLWNLPGQVYTTWKSGTVLNNVFHAKCLGHLMQHLIQKRLWKADATHFLLGIGSGGSTAAVYASTPHLLTIYDSPVLHLNGLLLINSIVFIDAQLASFCHDYLKVLACTPKTRSDIPMSYYTRYLFSPDYLERLSSSLVLEVFGAIKNPITLQGVEAITRGFLHYSDTRECISKIEIPVMQLVSAQDAFVNSMQHAALFSEVFSIASVSAFTRYPTQQRARSCCITQFASGHELLQERRQEIMKVIDEFIMRHKSDLVEAGICTLENSESSYGSGIRDKHINEKKDARKLRGLRNVKLNQFSLTDRNKSRANVKALNPIMTNFERESGNAIYKAGSGNRIYPEISAKSTSCIDENPNLHEYMHWRVVRNKKRLYQMEIMAKRIQRSFSYFQDKKIARLANMHEKARILQSGWRDRLYRLEHRNHKVKLRAVRVLQKHFRGKVARKMYLHMRCQRHATIRMQAAVRKMIALNRLMQLEGRRVLMTTRIQKLARGFLVRKDTCKLRARISASILIQKFFRGHLGRRQYRKKLGQLSLSPSHTQGIAFARQALFGYEFRIAKLTSEIKDLTNKQHEYQKLVSRLQGEVDALDKILHDVIARPSCNVDESERGQYLDNIADGLQLGTSDARVDKQTNGGFDTLTGKRKKLASKIEALGMLEVARSKKEEELETFERKLVLLLQEQKHEIMRIQRKQENELCVSKQPHSQITEPSNSLLIEYGKTDRNTRSAETLMKIAFMSMSMSCIKAMHTIRTSENCRTGNDECEGSISNESNNSMSKNLSQQLKTADIADWSVEDVGDWLDSLLLTPYKSAFQEGAVDGLLLLHLNDDELKNVLGMEHPLHRKKILTVLEHTLRKTATENKFDSKTQPVLESSLPGPMDEGKFLDLSNIDFSELCSLVRHGKLNKIKKRLDRLPDKSLDEKNKLLATGEDETEYDIEIPINEFHINQSDANGNTLLILAAQNNHFKIVQYLVSKGADINHQNKRGNTAAHYAMAYNFFDLGAWILNPNEGGGRDDLLNEHELSPYDGLS